MENIPGPLEPSMDSSQAIKRRGNLPKDAVNNLLTWLRDHQEKPYPTEEEKLQFTKDGITLEQVSNWFINARRRYLPGMLERRGKNPEDFRVTRKKSKSSKLRNNSRTSEASELSNDVHQRALEIPETSAYSNIELECKTADLENSDKKIYGDLNLNNSTDKVCDLKMLSSSADVISLKKKTKDFEDYRKNMYDDMISNIGEGKMYVITLLSCSPYGADLKERIEDIENNLNASNRDSERVNSDKLSTHLKSSVKRKLDFNSEHQKRKRYRLEDIFFNEYHPS